MVITQKIFCNGLIVFFAKWADISLNAVKLAEDIAKDSRYAGLKFRFIDADKEEEVTADWKVAAVPTFLFVKDGEEKDRIVGLPSKDSVEIKMEEVFNV